jgi:hypothetical protein
LRPYARSVGRFHDLNDPRFRSQQYRSIALSCLIIGDRIGVWPVFSPSENEVVAGCKNKHMDFRLSVLKLTDGDRASVVVSTICTVHNLFGKLYLFLVVPFHRYGVRKLMASALAARRW